MKKFLHVLGHIGMITLQVANVSVKFVPPPFNIAVAGGAGIAQYLIALHQAKTTKTN